MEGKNDECEREEKICTCEEGLYIFWRGKKEGDMEKKKKMFTAAVYNFRRLSGVMVNLENNIVVKETRLSFLTVIFTVYCQKRK